MIAISFFVIWLRTRNHRIKYSPKKTYDKECTVIRLLDSNKVNSSTPILILKHECLIYLLFFLIQYWNYYWSIFYLLSFHIFFHYTCIMWAWLFRIELFCFLFLWKWKFYYNINHLCTVCEINGDLHYR